MSSKILNAIPEIQHLRDAHKDKGDTWNHKTLKERKERFLDRDI